MARAEQRRRKDVAPASQTSTVHTLVDDSELEAMPRRSSGDSRAPPRSASQQPEALDSDSPAPAPAQHKPHSRLDVVDPAQVAEDEAPPDVIWVQWDGPGDPANPLNWSKRRKWLISSVGIGFCSLVSLSVSGYSIAAEDIQEELDTTRVLALLGLTTFTMTFGAAPLILAPLSEVYGRSLIYLLSAVVFALFFLPQALARNIETVLVSRFISGCAGSTAVSLVGGTIADVWRADERGTPMAWFSFAAFGATGLGPVMFGYLVQEKGFRAVNWVMFAMSAAFAVGLPLLLKETRASVLLSRKAAKLRRETGDARYMSRDDFERGSIRQMMKTSLGRPVRLLFTEPVLVAMTAWISFQWGVLYLFLVSIPYVFGRIYEFNTGECGMIYVTQFIGSVIGMSMDQYCMRLYRANVAKRGPEARLYTAFVGGVCVPVGAFIFCFTAYPHVHWMAPTIGIVILYCGMYTVYLSAFNYLAEAYTLYASSALSAMSFVRNCVGAVFPLFTTQMYTGLGIQGAAGLTAGLGTLLSATPFVLFIYGARLRARSPFAQELQRRAEKEEEEEEEERTRSRMASRAASRAPSKERSVEKEGEDALDEVAGEAQALPRDGHPGV
ncbi:major facilitator superfamily domain-containing protein [Rhodotorula diobovata]|uniref:Major facilitator superfamily domain-containing protein n=1 Tax=Rhodotorula diobovata TaxID=5288 RepID=A0A5C5FV61_9BASI|nr:major facilitator superfamily domain-containing protein [Rhodotorula diobovata]